VEAKMGKVILGISEIVTLTLPCLMAGRAGQALKGLFPY
jgi:hypothetical protein